MTRRDRGHLPPHGNETIRNAAREERERVAGILDRDRADRLADHYRAEARIELASGNFANIGDSVEVPTREQFARAERSGGFARFTPRGENGTSRTVTAYRRRDLPQVQRLVLSGAIDGDGLRNCIWYRNLVESAGLAGNIGSVDYGREVFSAPHSRSAFSDAQVEKQDTLRRVKSLLPSTSCALLDQIVVSDVPLWRAVKASGLYTRSMRRSGRTAAQRLFAQAIADLGTAREATEGRD